MLEVAEGKVNINQQKHVPIGIDCDLLNPSHSMSTSHSISHVTLFFWWPEQGSLAEVHYCLTTQYYSVLQSTTLYYTVLQRTTPHYKILQSTRYYSILQSISKYYAVLLRPKKCFKALLRTTKYYSVLQSRSVLQSTTKYYSVWKSQHMKRHLHSAEQPMGCKIMELRHSCLIVATHEMSFTPVEQPMWCKAEWKYDIHVWLSQRMRRQVHCAEQPMGCKTHWNYDIEVW